MAYVTLNKSNLINNFKYLDSLFKRNNIDWAIVSKLLCGSKEYLKILCDLDIHEICDSRISNLKLIKELNPNINTVYIKPPAKDNIEDVVRYSDVSFNTEYSTIKWISEEAKRQNRNHKIIIMIELGDLREGVLGEELTNFYEAVFGLPNIEITGIGSNLNCLHGVLPSTDKLLQLSLYKKLIEAQFKKEIPWVTGGTSVTIPLLLKKQIPADMNHFRVGETLYFGNNLINNELIEGMNDDVIRLHAQIIEINEKPKVPIGQLDLNPSGEKFELDEEDYGEKSYRALIDIGVLDISNTDFLIPLQSDINIVGASSDMLVIDLGENSSKRKVGDFIEFKLKYMGALRVFNSEYIDKIVI
ncbi:MAG: alanine/ornithine racemase family PLP-dependent enzyme [Ignavibacteriae bacterium]|nr:alanine/ornithine racemase family PLP-dependent enzyme [Ignavibacteriota bacterium]